MVKLVKWKTIAFILWLFGLVLTYFTSIDLGLSSSAATSVTIAVGFFSFFTFGGIAIILVALDNQYLESHPERFIQTGDNEWEFVDK